MSEKQIALIVNDAVFERYLYYATRCSELEAEIDKLNEQVSLLSRLKIGQN